MDDQGNREELYRRFKVLSTSTIVHDRTGTAKVDWHPFVKTVIKQAITPRQSSAGAFDTFSLEIQQEICKHLDFKSIVKFSQTSYAAKIIVDSVFTFTKLTSKAPRFLKAIAKLGLIHVNSVATIAHVLSSSSCDFCPNFGAYFFPLTGSRCCFFCLSTEPEFSLITKRQAIKCFGSSSIKGLPSVVTKMFCPATSTRLTEIVECFSAQKVVECSNAQKVVDMSSKRRYKTRQYYNASGNRLQPSQHRRNWEQDQNSESTYAVAVRIPTLRDSESPNYMGGYYCRPCIMLWSRTHPAYRHKFWEIRVVKPYCEDDSAKKIVDGTLNLPVRTIDEHFKHTETCANAQAILWQKRDYISGKK